MKVSNSIVSHVAHPSIPNPEQVSRYIKSSVEETPSLAREVLAHTPFQVPHSEDKGKVAHTFDGRSGGLGLLMKIIDVHLGHHEMPPSALRKVPSFEELA